MSVAGTVRARARHVALDAVSTAHRVSGRIDRAIATKRVHNLYLHSVPPSEEARFRTFLAWLDATGHTFIPYSEGVERVRSGSIDQAYVTLSFDDGYASNRRTAELLGERGISACFFVVTDFIGLTDLQEARAFLGQGIDEAAMTWTDVEQLLSTGHEVGSHTLAHRNLASLSPAQQEEAINDAADMLDRRIGGAAHFAWPLGRWFHMDAHARDTALQRHESCASAERGSHPSGVGPSPNFCPRRDHVMTSWPLRHLQYFTAAGATTGSARGASAGAWPSEW